MELTVGELKKMLEGKSDDIPVYVPSTNGVHDYLRAHTAKTTILEKQDADGFVIEQDDQGELCFIIDCE